MPTKKYKQKLIKHRICSVARIVACVSFVMLAIIGVSSLVKAMSLESVEHQNGIPSSWKVASLGNPETITVPITYWDQREDSCTAENRQFEWSNCRLYAKGIIPGVVKNRLGSDGHPVPSYTNSTDAWAAYHDAFTANITGHDPVQSSDNFYRWFHETTDASGKQLSKQYDREITFRRTGNNTYEYGSKGTFPLDNVDFSKDDEATKSGHNFHFTAHLQIPMKIAADGSEHFWFSGDDDVWVFLNGQLVLDLGGLHMDTEGSFTVDKNGNVISTVNNVNTDINCRQNIPNPKKVGYDIYNSRIESCKKETVTTTIPTSFKAGDVVNLDFFYAERSTSESNTRITISNMQWPISADSNVEGKIAGKIENTSSNLVEYTTSITNRDPKFALDLERMSVYLHDEAKATDKDGNEQTFTNSGFVPLSESTLSYTTTPNDASSWKPVEITPPTNSDSGFTLKQPITLKPSGQAGDTAYFRYLADTSEYSGNITNRTSFYTNTNGMSGVTFDHTVLPYTGKTSIEDGPEEPQLYQLNINYVVDFEGADPDPTITAPAAVHQELPNGESYNIPSPEIPGFTPDKSVVNGTIDNSDTNWTVTYKKTPVETPETYKLTIHYVKTDGSEAFPDHISEHRPEETVNITSPELPGHTHEPTTVTATITDHDIEEYVRYTPIPVKHSVTIHYVHSDGSTAFPDYTGEYAENERFSINSPDKSGYHKDIAVVSGVMGDHDRTFTVTYTPNSTPVGPTDPVDPNPNPNPDPTPIPDPTPSEPEPNTPITPNEPEENDNLIPSIPVLDGDGDELIYLGPLGEVAFVPNTGVISDRIAPIFEQYFAEVILSQGFVLVVLLIFAGSFATYFSLRKYLTMNMAPATRSAKVMPKSVANSKTARNMQCAAKKSASRRTVAKSTSRKTASSSPTRTSKTATSRKRK